MSKEITRPPLDSLTIDQKEYIDLIEQEVLRLNQKLEDMLDEDSVKSAYYILNAKFKESMRVIDGYDIKIDESDSKAYERFWLSFKDIKEVAGNITWLKSQIFGDKAEPLIKNPMELHAKSKQK